MRFPDCWNGTDLDSSDHMRHMAYSKQAASSSNTRVCPSTHPRVMPHLALGIRYAVTPLDVYYGRVRLAPGASPRRTRTS